MHLSLVASLETIQTPQFQDPEGVDGALRPAAPQLNPLVGGTTGVELDGAAGAAGVAAAGRGLSQAAHFSLAASLLIIQTSQVQDPEDFAGALMPAAPQLNPLVVGAGGAEVAGRGLSQAAHFSLSASLLIIQTSQVQDPEDFDGALMPAAPQLNPLVVGAAAGTLVG